MTYKVSENVKLISKSNKVGWGHQILPTWSLCEIKLIKAHYLTTILVLFDIFVMQLILIRYFIRIWSYKSTSIMSIWTSQNESLVFAHDRRRHWFQCCRWYRLHNLDKTESIKCFQRTTFQPYPCRRLFIRPCFNKGWWTSAPCFTFRNAVSCSLYKRFSWRLSGLDSLAGLMGRVNNNDKNKFWLTTNWRFLLLCNAK